ncbi:MAG TPA: asparagine--tRNA ligase [Myxococcaceae bacterium]|nr:asparagine--tRNA ligase [Myxococcaceae bacterium]
MSLPVVRIQDIGRFEGQDVELRGWLYNKRSSGKLHFLQVRDGSGIIQAVVFKGDVTPEQFQEALHLGQETSLKVRGTVRKDERSPLGFELGVKDFEVVGRSSDYPISPKEHGVAFLMDRRHLWLRSSRQNVILRVRHTVAKAIRDYFDARDFTLVDAPIFTPNASEGTSTLFEVPYFDLGSAYLTQSGQLYMEAAAASLGKVYCFGPTFRAEKSKTRRHLTEFWMVEPEVAYMTLEEDMDLAEDFLCFIVQRVLEKHEEEMKNVLGLDTSRLHNIQKPFPRITYTEAVETLKKAGHPIEWGDDFGGDEETVLANAYDRPVIVHRYPAAMKAFYFKRDPGDSRLALGMDILAPEGPTPKDSDERGFSGEIIGGGEREADVRVLEDAIREHGLPMEAFEWYLDLRRYGTVPHSGFGLGLERTVAWLCGLHHVRETIPFPRMMERLTP